MLLLKTFFWLRRDGSFLPLKDCVVCVEQWGVPRAPKEFKGLVDCSCANMCICNEAQTSLPVKLKAFLYVC